ncbi:hypothetical protein SADUNF_Sadunf08G0066300 [Salix dunnii]|uniref:Uncharacterized protein n=1 Tax=Salix dunnii TaxID=1413687 RepID=A0A835JTA5_9ROSI|nr:hypothetical protein SADUNF_Sadunf08G0066300 [Salix dunnii]
MKSLGSLILQCPSFETPQMLDSYPPQLPIHLFLKCILRLWTSRCCYEAVQLDDQCRDYELEKGDVKYSVNLVLNYLFLTGKINRALCVWKVACACSPWVQKAHALLWRHAKTNQIGYSTNSKDCGCTDVELRGIPIEVSKMVLTSNGPWGPSYGVVRETNCSEILLNEIPSRADKLMHRLNILFLLLHLKLDH